MVSYFYGAFQLLPQVLQSNIAVLEETELMAIEAFKRHLFTAIASMPTADSAEDVSRSPHSTVASIARQLADASDTAFNDSITCKPSTIVTGCWLISIETSCPS